MKKNCYLPAFFTALVLANGCGREAAQKAAPAGLKKSVCIRPRRG